MKPEAIQSSEFDHYAGDYDQLLDQGLAVSGEGKEYFAEGRIDWVKACLEQLSVFPHRVMDYGCGTGSAVPLLLDRFNPEFVIGVDPSPKSIERASQDFRSRRAAFRECSQYVPQEDIDLVYCNGVFHHIPVADRTAAMHFIWRSLKPGGYFALWENNPWNPGTRYVMSRVPFDRDAVMISATDAGKLLRTSGFHIERTNYLFIFPKVFRILRWIEPHVANRPFGAQYLVLGCKSKDPS